MISFCLPTRGRPEAFKKMCSSALETANDPDDIEFVSYHDNDDKSVYEYVGKHTEITGDRILLAEMWNKCQKIAMGDIFVLVMDDAVFLTKGWDKAVKDAFAGSRDKILLVYFDDLYYRSNHGSVCCLHKNWVDTVGYFAPPYFAAERNDMWINEVAYKIDRRYFLRKVIVKHFNIISDDTHKDFVIRNNGTRALYKSTLDKREKDAELLKEFIKNYGT